MIFTYSNAHNRNARQLRLKDNFFCSSSLQSVYSLNTFLLVSLNFLLKSCSVLFLLFSFFAYSSSVCNKFSFLESPWRFRISQSVICRGVNVGHFYQSAPITRPIPSLRLPLAFVIQTGQMTKAVPSLRQLVVPVSLGGARVNLSYLTTVTYWDHYGQQRANRWASPY